MSIPTLDGRVTVRVPENSRDGHVLRVRGRGINPQSGNPGALRATLRVVTPPAGAASEQLAAYAEALDASDLILPMADATLAEVKDMLSGDGLIPG